VELDSEFSQTILAGAAEASGLPVRHISQQPSSDADTLVALFITDSRQADDRFRALATQQFARELIAEAISCA
jgi:hypothetical protein